MAAHDDERPESADKAEQVDHGGAAKDRSSGGSPPGDDRSGGSDDARPRPGGPPRDREQRQGGGRPPGKRSYGERGRSYGDRSYGDRGGGRRTQGGPPYGDRAPSRRPDGDRPRGDGPTEERRYGNRPQGDRPYGNRPQGDRPYARRPGGDRPPGGRPYGEGHPGQGRTVERSHGPRPSGPRPRSGPWMRDQRPRQQGYGQRSDEYPAQAPHQGPSPAELLSEGEEVVAGRRPVEEAFAARRAAKRLLVVPERRAALDQLVLHATTLRIPVVEVEGGSLTAVSGFDGHQGVALVVEARRWATIDEVFAAAKAKREAAFVLVLDHLEDPQNVGTLLRSAEACGVHGVLFPTRGAAPISPAAVKTSAGAVEHLLLVPLPDLASGLVELHARGVRIVGADGDASMTVREADLRGPVAIVVGSEGRGLHSNVRKRVDLMARIPMRGRVASLNASVAGSVFLFEAAAQRDLPEAERPDTPSVHIDSSEHESIDPTVEAIAEPAIASAAAEQSAEGVESEQDDLLPEAPPPEVS